MLTHRPGPILIAGPTASGKSALALERAEACGGVVINADSMQVYAELSILSARPSVQDEARAPHRLYGHVPASEAYSVARWLEDVARVLAEATASGRRPIIVGGTGLYFQALTEGLSPLPPIPADLREHWRRLSQQVEPAALHAMLRDRDPVMADRLSPSDAQRITRALEVLEATGRSLAEWQMVRARPLVDLTSAECWLVSRPRGELHRRCDQRFDLMMQAGALQEVSALMQLRLPPTLPAMRALGVRPLAAHLEGRLPLEVAVARAKVETRQYVKRQETWARRYMADWQRYEIAQ
jgi:tRNA dimethylallyltransferase